MAGDGLMIDPDAPFTLAEVVATLEARQPGSYAGAVETIDDLALIIAADIGRAQPGT